MIALIRKNLRLWGYGKSLALFAGCILFSISGRLNGGIAYERHILSAVSDHYYLTYFVLPIVLLSCFSFIDDDGEPVILRFQSYHSYFLKKWIGVGLMRLSKTARPINAVRETATGSRSPAGPRRLRNSDAHKHIAVPQALCTLREHTRPRPKSGNVHRSAIRPRRVSDPHKTVRG